jgi:hypothetical protein
MNDTLRSTPSVAELMLTPMTVVGAEGLEPPTFAV